MDEYQIKRIMKILRPAIWAMYGRQKLRLAGYTLLEYEDDKVKGGWFEVVGVYKDGGDEFSYKAKIEDRVVTSLSTGRLRT